MTFRVPAEAHTAGLGDPDMFFRESRFGKSGSGEFDHRRRAHDDGFGRQLLQYFIKAADFKMIAHVVTCLRSLRKKLQQSRLIKISCIQTFFLYNENYITLRKVGIFMKRVLFIILTVVLLLGICACNISGDNGKNNESVEQSVTREDGVIFTDDLGREVAVNNPERVAAMIGSFADIWDLAGGGDRLVATAHDTWTSFDLDLSEDVVDLGLITKPDVEALIAADPDFVIASTNTDSNLEMQDTLETAGITVGYFDVQTFDDYLRVLKIFTDITGDAEAYEEYGAAVQTQVDDAVSRKTGEAPTVLYIRATGKSVKIKDSDSVLGAMLSDFGCINPADEDESLLEDLSLEAIMNNDPDYIFVVLQGADSTDSEEALDKALLSNPAWSELRAVKENNYHVMDQSLYNLKPNDRWGEAYEKLADILYPES